MANNRSASYTRGILTSAEASGNFTYNPLNKEQQHNFTNNPNGNTTSGDYSCMSHQTSFPGSGDHNNVLTKQESMGLQQYRRHAASLSAAPIRGAAFACTSDLDSVTMRDSNVQRPRSASWTPESPKALHRYSKGVGERKAGILYTLLRRFDETKYFGFRSIKKNKKECLSWFMLACLIVVGYKFFSDGSFSAVLTLASALQCFALALLNMKVLSQQSVAGVSQRTLMLIVSSLSMRLVSTMFYNGYLPVDRSGDWVYQAADVVTVVLAICLIVYSRRYCQASIQQQRDKDTCAVVIPVIIAFILSLFIHPTLNQNLVADVAWTFALYVETFSMVPQLFMMGKLGGEVEALTSHYTASMAGSKVFAFLFWYFSYNELAPRTGAYNLAGWAVLFSNSAQVLLFADFFYYYIKSMRVGRKMIINF